MNVWMKMSHLSFLYYLYFGLCLFIPVDSSVCSNNISDIFISKIMNTDGNLTSSEFSTFLSKFIVHHNESINKSNCSSTSNLSELKSCVSKQCLSVDDLLRIHSIPQNKTTYTADDVQILTPALLFRSQKESCDTIKEETTHKKNKKPSSAESWGFGFLFVTLINICSLTGALVLPFMKKKFYNQILIFMVALAVGSLAGSGLLFLIPEALGLVGEHNDFGYIWKGTTVMGGIYLFFIIERVLQAFMQFKKRKNDEDNEMGEFPFLYEKQEDDSDSVDQIIDGNISSFKRKTPQTSSQKYRESIGAIAAPKNIGLKECNSACSRQRLEESMTNISDDLSESEPKANGNTKTHPDDMVIHTPKHKEPIKTVAWMIIFGDGFHNFIDGLSIGAAFTDSILAGISISLAVICEELPHELGDFAILLNAGLSVKKALLFNFLSACMCYFGLIIGTVLGENTSASEWIFGIAGGMFLYISLVDMMPEMNSAAECEEKVRTIGAVKIFILQNLGLICGFGILLLMAVYGGEIGFE